ncbi:MAG TPA: biotin--[acetyl-CoA-carboxylase] ligase [Candidatus Dormibacteraeota bacterium]|nr:biotin--[acetyl-CoA-carboxylase] ligase [Candidatus Dormibacteraeota bacterium]
MKGEARVVRLKTVTSTQDAARELDLGSIVVADHQTAGRGRTNHRWEAPSGTALLVSFVLAPNPLLSLAAGVAAAEACGPKVRLKWPNDLLLDGRKLGGILVEAAAARATCGIGINLAWAPDGGAKLDQPREPLLLRLIESVGTWTEAPPDAVLSRWRELSDTLGRRVQVHLPDRSIEGMARDIGPRGELLVDGETIVAGSVIHL